jgi:hypothetical protein
MKAQVLELKNELKTKDTQMIAAINAAKEETIQNVSS